MKRLLSIFLSGLLMVTLGCSPKDNPKLNFIFKTGTNAGIVAKVGVKEISSADLFKGMEQVLGEAEGKEFEVKFNRIRAHVLEYFMNQDPRKGSLTNDEFLEKFIVTKMPAISDKEVIALAKEKQIPQEQLANNDMKEKIRYYIGMLKKRDVIEAWLTKVVKSSPVTVYMNLPADKKELYAQALANFNFAPVDASKILTIGKKDFTEDEIFAPVRNDIFEAQMALYDVKLNALKALLVDEFVSLDPASKDQKVEEYLDKTVYGKIEINAAQIDAFIKEKNIPATAVNDQLKERVKDYMMNTERQKSLEKWLAERTQSMPVEVYFSAPTRPIFNVDVSDSIFAGGKDAKVVIAEFTDFECPFCSKGSAVMKEVKALYGDKVKVVFKNFPLPFHENARLAHQMALCSAEQSTDLFWKAYYHFFGDQSKLDANSAREGLKSLGADLAKMDECLKTDRAEKIIARDFEQAQKLGVNSTPTFYINGQLINGAQDISVFKEIIDAELAK